MAVGRSRRRARHRSPPGAPPGTIAVDPDAPKPVIRVIALYDHGERERARRLQLFRVNPLYEKAYARARSS
jgi:hypothetical protein